MIAIAMGVSMDAMVVAMAAGASVRQLNHGHVIRLALCFGFFQSIMFVIGWLAGSMMESFITTCAPWVAFALLAFLGGKMLWQALHLDLAAPRDDPTRGWLLLTLSLAASIDALAVGLGLAFLRVSIWTPSSIIGVNCAILSAVGMRFGGMLGARFRRWAEICGGLLLIGIGLNMLVSHVTTTTAP